MIAQAGMDRQLCYTECSEYILVDLAESAPSISLQPSIVIFFPFLDALEGAPDEIAARFIGVEDKITEMGAELVSQLAKLVEELRVHTTSSESMSGVSLATHDRYVRVFSSLQKATT